MTFDFNIIDIAVAFIVVASVLFFSYKGLVMAIFDFLSLIISIVLAYTVYPQLVAIISSQESIMAPIREAISKTLGIEAVGAAATRSAETALINSVPIPDFLKAFLLENNNAEVYRSLAVNNISDYIVSYLANLFITILAFVIVFVLVFIVMKIVAAMLDLASRLPVINTLNKLGGAAIGLVIGVIFVYLMLTVLSVIVTFKGYEDIIAMVEASKLAEFFYENNLLMQMINKIF